VSSFDERAATWDDDPAKVERARAVAESIRESVRLSSSMRLLEYGAGTGLVSQALAGDVGPITLADPSAGMREVMRAKVANGTLPDSTRIWDLDLSTDRVPDERFDLIATVMTLHHIPDLTPVLAAFADMLDDHGRLCVVDLVEEDGSFHSGGDFHGHHGFDTDDMARRLDGAGLADVSIQRTYDMVRDGVTYPLFLATGTKSASRS
jgi:ubiquinone/menaquinone biosynthesis C-methylase UbiE